MLVRFRTQGDMNFGQFQYVVVFNTSGNGQEPYANANITGYANYSYAFVITGSNATVSLPKLIQYFQNPTVLGGISTVQVVYPPQLVTFIPPPSSNGSNREFTLIFSRSLFNQPNPAASPTPLPTMTPSPSPSPVPSLTPTPNPGASASATPSPSPSPTASGLSPIWTMNFFTTDASGNPIDSLGVNGAMDTSYLLKFDVTQNFDLRDQLTKATGSAGVFSQSAAIAGGEIQNVP